MLALAVSTHAQETPAQSDDEIVHLSPFSVQETADMGRYQAAQVSSGTRIRMDLMDSTQSVSVLTNEFMNDVGTTRVHDAVKYVAGIDANNNDIGNDMFVRGFQSFGVTLDGFYQMNWTNQEPAVIERIEVVKGPNAILAPQGLPGGVVNLVTKKPLFSSNQGYVSYQVGRYAANRAEFDANYVVRSDKLAIRVVGAVTDDDAYGRGELHQNITVAPMLTYRLSPTTEVNIQWQAYNSSYSNNSGIPVSVYAVGRDNVKRLEGLPRDFQVGGRNNTRHASGQYLRFTLTSQITDKLSMRFAGNGTYTSYRSNFIGPSAARLGGVELEPVQLDPITGEWGWDGVTRNDNPTYNLGGDKTWFVTRYGNIQNDFAYEHIATTWRSKTVAGWVINTHSNQYSSRAYTTDTTEYDFTDPNYTPPGYTIDTSRWRFRGTNWLRSNQAYLYQVFNLFDDRLVLSGGLSQNRYFSSDHDTETINDYWTEDRGETLLPSAGFVYKLTSGFSVFYGYSEQEILGRSAPSVGIPSHTLPSRQHEGGVRVRLFDGKLYATLSYFDILQDNLWLENPANLVTPEPVPRLPAMRTDRTAKGFEFEINWSPNKNFSVIASYTDFENRDQDNQRYSNVSEKIGSLWGSYTFDEGPLRGLKIGIGGVYTGEAPNMQGFYTSPPAGFQPVRIQPIFWIPSYVLAEANASYRFGKHWHAELHIKNLFNKDAVIGGINRSIHVSTPINPKLTLRYEF